MLERRSYAVDCVYDGDGGLQRLFDGAYDAAIVDVVLPHRDGFSIARAARESGAQLPILLLTARDSVEDRVAGLDSGADDYLVKPFAEEELIARIRALLRRGDRPVERAIEAGTLRIDPIARTASCNGKTMHLGATEFRLLELFVRNKDIALSRSTILERVWEYEFDGSSNIVDVYVSQLRRKLKSSGFTPGIETVWGLGYRLRA